VGRRRTSSLAYDRHREAVVRALKEGVTLEKIVRRFGSPGASINSLYYWIWQNQEAAHAYRARERKTSMRRARAMVKCERHWDLIAQELVKSSSTLHGIAERIGVSYDTLRIFVHRDVVLRQLYGTRSEVIRRTRREMLRKVLSSSLFNYSKAGQKLKLSRERVRQLTEELGLIDFVRRGKGAYQKAERMAKRAHLLMLLQTRHYDKKRVAKQLGISVQTLAQRMRNAGLGANYRRRSVIRLASALQSLQQSLKEHFGVVTTPLELVWALTHMEKVTLEGVLENLLRHRKQKSVGGANEQT